MRRLARQYLSDIKVDIPSVDALVETLSGGQRQAVRVGESHAPGRRRYSSSMSPSPLWERRNLLLS